MRVEIYPYQLHFLREAKTSRNTMVSRPIWILKLLDESEECYGIGECAPLFGLSQESEKEVIHALERLKNGESPNPKNAFWRAVPSVVMAFEMALSDLLSGGKRIYFGTDEMEPIPINGLVWMNDRETMIREAFEKIEQGFTTIKLKVGSLDFDDEISILNDIRTKYSAEQITLRLDANGAFNSNDVFQKMQRLSEFHIHSIEQPVKAGQWQLMREVCEAGIIPVALDEELIGVNELDRKEALLSSVQPQFIILKPSLHGGFEGADEWIRIADSNTIPWWATSALESSFGLLAIAQWVSQYHNQLPQGLGTGALYSNNFSSPLVVEKGFLKRKADHAFHSLKWN